MSGGETLRALEREIGELLERHAGHGKRERFAEYRDEPVRFIEEVLGGTPWSKQKEIAEAVRDHPQVTVRSCHASGKDWLAARLALWWTYARQGRAVLTGPTAAQVEEILMRGELRAAFSRAEDLPGELHVRALRPGGDGQAGIVAKTATAVDQLTGFHETELLFVITEAQDPEISHAWKAAFACATGEHDRILTLGNPTVPSGRFYRAHRPNSGWKRFQIAASDIPNVREGETVVPGLLSREGAERFAREYGLSSGVYSARVLAEFPEQSEEGLLRRSWLEAAARRSPAETEDVAVVALDPARHGPDASVLAVRQGRSVTDLVVWEGEVGAAELKQRVLNTLAERGLTQAPLLVDAVGLGGSVADWLAAEGLSVVTYKASGRPAEPERFANIRAEAFWRLRQHLERGRIGLPDDEILFEELLAHRWHADARGRVQVGTKQGVKGRLGRSPDRADAVAMVCYPCVPQEGLSPATPRSTGSFEDDIIGNFLDPKHPRRVVDQDRRNGWAPL